MPGSIFWQQHLQLKRGPLKICSLCSHLMIHQAKSNKCSDSYNYNSDVRWGALKIRRHRYMLDPHRETRQRGKCFIDQNGPTFESLWLVMMLMVKSDRLCYKTWAQFNQQVTAGGGYSMLFVYLVISTPPRHRWLSQTNMFKFFKWTVFLDDSQAGESCLYIQVWKSFRIPT